MSEREVVYDFDPRNLPAEYLQAIGLVAAASSQTESIMSDFIGALLGIDNVDVLAFATHMANPLKDHIARALIELKTNKSAIVDTVDDLLDTIRDAFDKRNTLVHNPLIQHPDGKILSYRLKARGSLQLELTPISVEEIQENATLIYESGVALLQFMLVLGLEPRQRTAPLMEPLNRKTKARAKRRLRAES